MKVRVARDYQCALRDFALDNERCQWWAGTGTGKTSSWLDVFEHRRLFGEANRMLVVSTKNIATIVWPEELAKWENFNHLSLAIAIGSPEKRKQALQLNTDITCINYDNLAWLAELYGEHWPFDFVVADESTRLKNLRIDLRTSTKGKQYLRKSGGGSRAYALAKVAHKRTRFWINGTGTPCPNGLIDLWGQGWYIDAGQRLGRTFTSFKDRWFNSVRVDAYKTLVRPTGFADEQIKAALSDITMTIEAKDYFDLPPMLINPVRVRMEPDAARHYREMEKEFFTLIKTHDIEAVNEGSKGMKLRQLANGAAYYDDSSSFVEVGTAKLDRIEDIVNEANGAAIIIGYQFKSDLARLTKRFPKARVFSSANRRAFMAGEFQIMLAHPGSVGHGIDGLQEVCHNMVLMSISWDLEEFQQILERIGPTRQVSSGFYRTVYISVVVSEDTIDDEMFERIESKASVQDSVKAAMKKRGPK